MRFQPSSTVASLIFHFFEFWWWIAGPGETSKNLIGTSGYSERLIFLLLGISDCFAVDLDSRELAAIRAVMVVASGMLGDGESEELYLGWCGHGFGGGFVSWGCQFVPREEDVDV